MTIASEVNRSGPYNGNGVTTTFAYQFKIYNPLHLQIIKTDPSGAEAVLTYEADYTVTGVGDDGGGSAVLLVAPAAGYKITLLLEVPFTQETDLENQGAYYAETVERALDLVVMRLQQLRERSDRAVTIPASADASDLAGLIADILRMADSADNIDTVATNIADVSTVATNIASVIMVAANIADVTNFADVYYGPKAANPILRNDGSAMLAGDLYFNTVDHSVRFFDGGAWLAIDGTVTAARISNVLADQVAILAKLGGLPLAGGTMTGDITMSGSSRLIYTGDAGKVDWFATTVTPPGYLDPTGAAVPRATFPALFAALVTNVGFTAQTVTVDFTTDIFTKAAHGFNGGERVRFFSTGTIPAPLAANTDYFAIYISANTFYLATTAANAEAGTKVDITNNGTGVITYLQSLWGLGDGVTTFNLPNAADMFVRASSATRQVGTYQRDIVGPHTHPDDGSALAGSSGAAVGVFSGGKTGSQNSGAGSGTETRPKNIGLKPFIKYN